ncbi:MAG: TauD/TfdA family dioxygenase [Spirosomataceae bacterium]
MEFFKRIEYQNAEAGTQALKEAITQYKAIHMANFTFDVEPHQFYERISDEIGIVHNADEDKETGALTGERWIDITFDPEVQNRYRSSKTKQPLHTDDSYIPLAGTITFFYCASQANIGGATTFIDADLLLQCLEMDEEFDLINDLQQIEVKHEKGGSFKSLPILRKDASGWLLNWNWHCVAEDNTPEAKDLAQRFHNFLETRVHNAGIVTPVILKKGEAVFFHDERILHGRYAFFTKEKGGRKLIKGTITLPEPNLA